MIFKHPETGLKVVVHEHEITESTKELPLRVGSLGLLAENPRAGEGREIVVGKELRTEAGQPCEPFSADDCHALLAVAVLTDEGHRIRLVRVTAP